MKEETGFAVIKELRGRGSKQMQSGGERTSHDVVSVKITCKWCMQLGRQPADWHSQGQNDALQAQDCCSVGSLCC